METRHRKPQGSVDSKAEKTTQPSKGKSSNGQARPLWQKIIFGLGALWFLYVFYIIVKPTPFEIYTYDTLNPQPEWTGPLAENNRIANAERLLEGTIHGPESFVFVGDLLYAGQSDGWVVEVDLKTMKLREVVRFGKPPCNTLEDELHCGRPLGMRLDKEGYLWVMDAYLGIFKITNRKTGEYEKVLGSDVPIDGATPKMLNDIEFGENGIIYFTDSSTRFYRYEYTNVAMCGEHTGRLVQYNTKTKEIKVLLSKLGFPNGIAKDREGNILIADTFYVKVIKYNVKTGKTSDWIPSLPGLPDNIRYQPISGTYLVALSNPRKAGQLDKLALIYYNIWLRRILSKVLSVRLIEGIDHIKEYLGLAKHTTLILEVNEQGEIIDSYQDHTGTGVLVVTEASVHKGDLYMGNYAAHYLGRIKGFTLAGQKK